MNIRCKPGELAIVVDDADKAEPLEVIENLLAHLICGDLNATTDDMGEVAFRGDTILALTDSGSKLAFAPMKPSRAYTFDGVDRERVYAADANLLLSPVQDLLGDETETAFLDLDGSKVKWTGYRRLRKPPRSVWVASPGATLYEVHYREIFHSGASTYRRRVAAVSKAGKPVPVVIVGSASGSDSSRESSNAILTASLVEDAHRPSAVTATITDATTIVLPVALGEHKDLFALRDAPLTPAGRRKAIVHWVSRHMRNSASRNNPAPVSAHWRGVREFSIDGMTVRLETNEPKPWGRPSHPIEDAIAKNGGNPWI